MSGYGPLAAALAGLAVLVLGAPRALVRARAAARAGAPARPAPGSGTPARQAPSGSPRRVLPLLRALPRVLLPARAARGRERALRAAGTALVAALADELRAGRDRHEALAAAAASLLPPPAPGAVTGAAQGRGADPADGAAGSSPAGRGLGLDPLLRRLEAVGRLGGDAGAALRAAGAAAGGAPLRRLAVCWDATAATGAGLAAALDRTAEGLAADDAVRREVQAQLAGPRATAGLLTVLPAVGLALGAGLGGDPVGALLGTGWGRACLAGGVLLVVLGRWWTARLARGVERQVAA
ncbi:type II secretion system F family protein [Vallicoccus soli]|uniref:type II secretion system F family protein n=1 Tax=Vallicoccus soli TaxID=2339232 RepID=UPI001403B2A9|nr:type II secretion system F family protein [Vallicoccus soli]